MTTQVWHFGKIAAGADEIHASHKNIESLLADGSGEASKLAGSWQGDGQEAFNRAHDEWNNASAELNQSLKNLAAAISEAGQAMATTESRVTGLFT